MSDYKINKTMLHILKLKIKYVSQSIQIAKIYKSELSQGKAYLDVYEKAPTLSQLLDLM